MNKVQVAKIPSDKESIAVFAPILDYSLDHLLGDYSDLLKGDNIITVAGEEKNDPSTLLRATPKVVGFFKCGAAPGVSDIKAYEMQIQRLITVPKLLGIKTIYYADDLCFSRNEAIPMKLAGSCDLTIVPSQFMKEWLYTNGFPSPVEILPPHVNLKMIDDATPNPIWINPDRINIALYSMSLVGVRMALDTMYHINKDPEFAKNFRFIMIFPEVSKVRVATNQFRNIEKVYLEPCNKIELMSVLKTVDIHFDLAHPSDLMARVEKGIEEPFVNSRSILKLLVAGACRKLLISSDSPVYKDLQHGEVLIKAQSPHEVVMFLKMILDDPSIKTTIGDRARGVAEQHDVLKMYSKFTEAFALVPKPPKPKPEKRTELKKIGWILCGPIETASARIEGVNISNWIKDNTSISSSVVWMPPRFSHHILRTPDTAEQMKKEGYDAIIFQKVFAGDTMVLATELKELGIKTVWSISDMLDFRMSNIVDLVITTNKYLADKFPKEAQDKIRIIKDAYESKPEEYKKDYVAAGPLKVVWYGSQTHYNMALALKPLVEDLGMEFITISNAEANPTKEWSLATITKDLLEGDMVVIPANLNDEFEKCKDENRLTQAMVLGLPVIAAPIPEYMRIRSQGIDSWIVANNDFEFYKAMRELQASQDLRETYGKKAREQVLDKYSIATISKQLIEELTKCLTN